MPVVWECERLCVAFQFVPQAGLTWNILGFPLVDLVGHLSRCLSVPARHWLWWLYPRSIDWVVPGYQTGSVKATGLSYRKPCLRIRRIDVYGWPVWSLHNLLALIYNCFRIRATTPDSQQHCTQLTPNHNISYGTMHHIQMFPFSLPIVYTENSYIYTLP